MTNIESWHQTRDWRSLGNECADELPGMDGMKGAFQSLARFVLMPSGAARTESGRQQALAALVEADKMAESLLKGVLESEVTEEDIYSRLARSEHLASKVLLAARCKAKIILERPVRFYELLALIGGHRNSLFRYLSEQGSARRQGGREPIGWKTARAVAEARIAGFEKPSRGTLRLCLDKAHGPCLHGSHEARSLGFGEPLRGTERRRSRS